MPRRTSRTTARKSSQGGVEEDLQALAGRADRTQSESELRQVLAGLAAALDGTVAKSRLRSTFKVGPGRARLAAGSLESELWQAFGPGVAVKFFLPTCDRLVGHSLTLMRDGDIGAIDLLGLADHDRLPVVLQVARGDTLTTTIEALLRAICGVTFMRRAWTRGLRQEWARALRTAGYGQPELPPTLGLTPASVIARDSHWSAIRQAALDAGSDVSTFALQRVHALIDAAAREGIFVSLAELRGPGPLRSVPFAWSARLPRIGLAPGGSAKDQAVAR